MHIKRAKEEIRNTIRAYLMKDEFGQYVIPSVRQRPVLLIGPPGIGKTAIMEQVARECGIALVSYTITHHTRQSAVGLPFIEHKTYNGQEHAVTEYTMSEIIASIYEKMEQTGLKEGILFIDEINCVSETLAPAMLQFLQCKTFGNRKIPEGWLIAAAGNPPEYNKSVRDFDVVTLDRVKKIDVTEDYSVWKEYAYEQGIHSSILTYLEIKRENFYEIETTLDGKRFVTARGWEDLSQILYTYEKLSISVDEDLIVQYLQHRGIAKDFAAYYDLYNKYKYDYKIDDILKGVISRNALEKLWQAPFDERLSVLGLLIGRLNELFTDVMERDAFVSEFYEVLIDYREQLEQAQEKLSESAEAAESAEAEKDSVLARRAAIDMLTRMIERRNQELEDKKEAGLINRMEERCSRRVLSELEAKEHLLLTADCDTASESFAMIKAGFNRETAGLEEQTEQVSQALEYAFDFVEKAFGEDQELVVFITELSLSYYAIRFISDNGCTRYYRYNKTLLSGEQQKEILQQIEELKKSSL
ncbi:MAG: AAA family ATPase [Lachnospiraceae bacterium]|nr:AAA family ATPase [Lachnospiraceae bacterium]